MTLNQKGISVLTLLVILFLILFSAGLYKWKLDTEAEEAKELSRLEEEKKQKEIAKQEAERKAEEKRCTESLICQGEKMMSVAEEKCMPKIQRYAKNNFEWGEGPIFKGFGRHKTYSKTLIYYGDNVKFQNGFGAWIQFNYMCEFNLANNEVFEVEVQKGLLPEKVFSD